MAKCDKEFGEMFQKVKSMEKILMGNGTKGLMRKMEEVCTAIIEIKEEKKVESGFDKWSRTRLIIIFGLFQAIMIVLLTYGLNRFGG